MIDQGVPGMRLHSTRRVPALSAGVALAALALAGCTSVPAPGAAATSAGTHTAAPAPSGEGQTPAPSASPSTSASAPAPSPPPSPQSMLDAVKHANCRTATFIEEAGLAGGALRAYVSKPSAAGVL